MSREKKTRAKAKASEPEVEELPERGEGIDDAEFDAVLEDIDDVLEENAQAFVEGFVQKGGE